MDSESRIHSLKRPAIERMMLIHKALQRGDFPNCSKLAKALEVSSKTISRDIDFMRDRMLLPIEYEPSQHGYCYTREVESLPTIDISEGELLALSIARKALDHYKGTPFEKPLANALNKLSASLPETITANLSELSDAVSFKHGRLSNQDEATLRTAIKGALEKRVLSFSYKKPGEKRSARRTVKPYHVTNYLGKWYLLAWDKQREAMRTFLLARAADVAIESETFELPANFSVDEYLWSSFGIWSPSGDYKVKLRVSSSIADHVSENIWHPTQTIESFEDGGLVLGFQLGSLDEVAQWLLSWGTQMEALEPSKLRTLVRKKALAIAERYT